MQALHEIEIIKPRRRELVMLKLKKKDNLPQTNMQIKILPRRPSTVLFGDMLLSLFLPIFLPMKNALISFIQVINSKKTKYSELSCSNIFNNYYWNNKIYNW